jgi:YD repeat-containing protein
LTARIFPVAVNYHAADGSWQPIDNTLVADATGFHNAANSFGVHVPVDISQGVSVSSGNSDVSLMLEGASGKGSVSGPSDTFAGVLPDVSVSYLALGSGVKETLRLQGSAAPSQFVFDLKVSAGLTPMLAPNGALMVVGHGKTVFVLPAPFAFAAASGSELPRPGVAAEPVKGALTGSGTAWKLTLRLDASWLAGALRAGDVVIDPTIDPAESQDCSLDSDSPTVSSCGASTLNAGYNSSGGGSDHRSLVQFNVRQALGPDAVVLNAQLGMYLAGESTSTAKPIGLYQVSRAWTAGTELISDCGYSEWVPLATWDTYDGTHAWTSPGGDFASNASTVNPAVGESLGWYYWYPTQLVQSWEDGAQNDGLLLKDTVDGQVNNELQFASGAYSDSSKRPYLQVSFEPRLGEQPQFTILPTRLTDRMGLDVNPASGNLILNNLDLNIAGTGLDFTDVRTWQSLDTGVAHAYGNWSDSNWIGATVYQDGSVAVTGLEDGAALPFLRQSDGSFLSPPGIKAVLCAVNGTTCTGTSAYALTFDASQERIDFNANGQVQDYVDRYGNTISATWESQCGQPFITKWTDTQGRTISQTCATSAAQIGSVTDQPGARSVSYNYDPTVPSQLDRFVDAETNTTTYGYTAGKVTQITTPAGNVVKITYDSSGQVTSVMRTTDSAHTTGPTTIYDYYNSGYPSWWTSNLCPAGSVKETVVFDADASTTLSGGHYTSSNGHFVVYCANAQDEVVAAVNSASPPHEHEYTYDQYGNMTLVQNTPGNGYLSYIYLHDDLLCAFVDSQPHTSCQDTTGLKTTYFYQDGAPGHQFLPTTITDPQGNYEQYCYYDGNQSGCPSDSGPNGALETATNELPTQNAIKYTYNSNGTVNTFTDADGNVWSYGYDGKGNPTSTTPPPGSGLGTPTNTPDAESRPHVVTDGDPGHSETITYDNLDRVTNIAYASGPTFHYNYDADGNLTSGTDPQGTTTYYPDSLGRDTEVARPDGTYTQYSWDPNSNLTSVYTDPGVATTYSYNGLNQNTEVNGLTTSATLSYDAEGRQSTETYGNGDQITYSYNDPAGRATEIKVTNSAGQEIENLEYDYHSGCNGSNAITGLVQCAQDQYMNQGWTYRYDTLNRLTSAQSSGSAPSYSYTLDGNGNHTSETVGSAPTLYYAYDSANELCGFAHGPAPGCDGAFTYDAAGNELTADDPGTLGFSYTYNNADQTTSITPPGSSSDRVTYRGAGEGDLSGLGPANYQATVLGVLAQYQITGGDGSSTRAHSASADLANVDDLTTFVRDAYGNLVANVSPTGTASYYVQDPSGSVVDLLDGVTGAVDHGFTITPDDQTLPSANCPPDTFGPYGKLNEPGGLLPAGDAGFYDPNTGSTTQIIAFSCPDMPAAPIDGGVGGGGVGFVDGVASFAKVPWVVDPFPAEEEGAIQNTLGRIDAGQTPIGALLAKWGDKFKNINKKDGSNLLPGSSGNGSPYKEYRVLPPQGTSGAGARRIVANPGTGEVYYTWTHYGDAGAPPFVRIR